MEDIGAPRVLEGLEILIPPEEAAKAPPPDLLVCLDCASRDRISVPFFRDRLESFRSLCIDHHESNPRFCDANFVAGDASSTGELVWDILQTAGWPISRKMAEALWVAITTDTGRFSYSCTHPSTLECGAALMRLGVRHEYLNDEIFSKAEAKAIRLKARAYASLELWFGGAAAIISLDADDYAACGCAKADSEDFVDIPRAVRGARMAVFIYRSRADETKTHLSIRSCGRDCASDFAALFGGGGHKAAAGATLDCGMAEAKARVKETLGRFLRQ
jgi:phosphoesterase RecJ-like protein